MSHKITIYPNFGQRLSVYNIDSITGVRLIPIMKSSKTDTLILYNNDMEPVDYEFIPGKDAFSVGNEVAVSENIGQYPKHTIGKIVSMTDDIIDLYSDVTGTHSYKITDYKQISVKEKTTKDQISIDIDEEDKGDIKLSYLFDNVGWNAHYTLILANEKIKIMKLVAVIQNKTNEPISGDVDLVAGNFSTTKSGTAERSVSKSTVENMNESDVFDEYHRYSVGDLCLEDKTSVTLSTVKNLNIEKFYQHNVLSGDKVRIGYRFVSPDFLPTGSVCIYKTYKKDLRYIGSGYIHEKQKDDAAELVLGSTTNVKVNSTVTVTNLDDYRKSVNIVSSVMGDKDVVLRYYVGNSDVISADINPVRKGNYLEWNAKGNTTVNINMTLSR